MKKVEKQINEDVQEKLYNTLNNINPSNKDNLKILIRLNQLKNILEIVIVSGFGISIFLFLLGGFFSIMVSIVVLTFIYLSYYLCIRIKERRFSTKRNLELKKTVKSKTNIVKPVLTVFIFLISVYYLIVSLIGIDILIFLVIISLAIVFLLINDNSSK